MKKPAYPGLVALSFASLFLISMAFVACDGGSSPTAPAAPTAPAKSLSSEPQQPGADGVDLDVVEKAKGPKVDVCHQREHGGYHIVNVAESAVPAHEGHGDWLVSPEVCDDVDNDCDGEVDEGGVCVPTAPLWEMPDGRCCFTCPEGATMATAPFGIVEFVDHGSTVEARVTLENAIPGAVYDIWLNQDPGGCPLPGPTAPGAIMTDASGNGFGIATAPKVTGATAFWVSATALAERPAQGWIFRSPSVAF